MMRNVFSVDSITYIKKNGKVVYRTGKIQTGKNWKDFSVYDAEEFIAAITQHIPKKSFQTIRYYGWKILKYLNLWEEESARDPPVLPEIPDKIVYVPIEDTTWEQHENPGFAG